MKESYCKLNADTWRFLAFNFELTNSHLFQQKIMAALHDSDLILVVTFLQIVIEIVH